MQVHPKLAMRHKFHLTLHIPEQILRFGPPRHYWCMRFEAKHKDIKSLTAIVNFINLPLTVCKVESMQQALLSHREARTVIKYDGNFLALNVERTFRPERALAAKLAACCMASTHQ